MALGEVMMRLDPGETPTARAREAKIYHGGGETNVAEGMSECFGLRTTIVTALVDDGIGRNIEHQLREAGVDTSYIIWYGVTPRCTYKTDEKGTLHNGINFTYRGKGVVPSVTEYYRAHTPIREVKPGDIKWDDFFAQGVRWFHTGGIYSVISPSSVEVALEAMQAAGRYGTVRSYDLNARSKVEPNKDIAKEKNWKLMPEVDVLFGNQSDFAACLGRETKIPSNAPFDDVVAAYVDTMKAITGEFPNLKVIGVQLRGAHSADRISWGAILHDVGSDVTHRATIRENVEIMDRTGGGDSFVSGVAAALLNGKGLEEAVQWGAAHGILVQETPGDTSMATQVQVLAEIARAQKSGGVSALR